MQCNYPKLPHICRRQYIYILHTNTFFFYYNPFYSIFLMISIYNFLNKLCRNAYASMILFVNVIIDFINTLHVPIIAMANNVKSSILSVWQTSQRASAF